MTMKTSTEATIDDGGTLVLLWQQNNERDPLRDAARRDP